MEGQFLQLFENLKSENEKQTTELKESITNSIMDRMDEKLKPLMEENKKLKEKVENLEKKIDYLEREKRNNNIIIYGLEETEKSTPELLQNIKKVFDKDLEINMKEYEINKIHRIGTKNKENKVRPVLLSFVNQWKKEEIMRFKKNFKEIYIAEDFSKEVLEKRASLRSKLIEERNKGNLAYLRYDKLVVKENQPNKEKRKREPSTSPQLNDQPRKQQASSKGLGSKINRTNAFDMMRVRSNSLSTFPPDKKQ